MEIKFEEISRQVQELIKNYMNQKGIKRTGNLINSIKVIPTEAGFSIEAEDYFYKIDEKYDIIETLEDDINKIIEDNIYKQLNEQQ